MRGGPIGPRRRVWPGPAQARARARAASRAARPTWIATQRKDGSRCEQVPETQASPPHPPARTTPRPARCVDALLLGHSSTRSASGRRAGLTTASFKRNDPLAITRIRPPADHDLSSTSGLPSPPAGQVQRSGLSGS